MGIILAAILAIDAAENLHFINRGYTVVNLTCNSRMLFCKIQIGKKEYNFLVDTGASDSFIDLSRLPGTFNWKDKGAVSFVVMPVKKVYSTTMTNISLDMVNMSYKLNGIPPIDGIIGAKSLANMGAVIMVSRCKIFIR